jgi:general secretion pathway protein E
MPPAMGMSSAARHLLVLSFLAALVGLIAVYLGAPEGGFTDTLSARIRRSHAGGPWLGVAAAGGALAGLAVLTTSGLWVLEHWLPRKTPAFDALRTDNLQEALREVGQRVAACAGREPPDVVSAFDELMRGAVKVEASDLHLTPTPETFKATYRVHGTLYEVAHFAPELGPRLTTRIKVLARLDTQVRGTPQDGRLVLELDAARVDARVSTLPTEGGERVVLRLVRGGRTVPNVDDLGFSSQVARGLRAVTGRPQGLFFVTGPVGSGKTTTLYACLKHIAATRGRTTTLVTLEDPVELELPFATQTPINPRRGITFAKGLRSVLRQDPNVLMLGEIRDQETAEIAVQAGLTGHLILTTVHAESAAGPFARLADIHVEAFALASASVGALSQRLVRTLCTACRHETEPTPAEVERFARAGIVLPPGPYFSSDGCDYCEKQGFTGRTPIAELLIVDSVLERAITERRTTTEIHELAIAEGMTPLLRDGLDKACSGTTSIAEVLRVAG